MKINLFKYPIGTVVKCVLEDGSENMYGHVLGFMQTTETDQAILDVQWSDGIRSGIHPRCVQTYNDL
jgi:hypothetical protein